MRAVDDFLDNQCRVFTNRLRSRARRARKMRLGTFAVNDALADLFDWRRCRLDCRELAKKTSSVTAGLLYREIVEIVRDNYLSWDYNSIPAHEMTNAIHSDIQTLRDRLRWCDSVEGVNIALVAPRKYGNVVPYGIVVDTLTRQFLAKFNPSVELVECK
jgi:hypothetical protein